MKTKPTPKRKGGRPTKCTPKLIDTLVQELTAGASLSAACRAAGITPETRRQWEKRAEAGQEPYAGFLGPLKKAEGQAVAEAEKRVKAGKPGWQGSARWLESMKPDVWRRTDKHELQHSGA
ncbi:MAG: hypothetical protein U9R68_06325, partial [Planctomycetota bacterium]|nr:hypothetical protein [Planctomycetota bacterium]